MSDYEHLPKISGYFISDEAGNLPEILGVWFAQAFSGDQARFLTAVAETSSKWKTPACFQWAHIARDLPKESDVFAMIEHMADNIKAPQGTDPE